MASRAQSEAVSAADAEVVILARRLDHHPVAVKESLRVHHPRLGATERPIIPDHRFCPHDHQLLAIDLPSAAASFRIGSRIACGTCPFMGEVSPVVETGTIIDDVTIRVSVFLRSPGSVPKAAKARIAASASATPLAPRSYRCFESALKWSVAMRSMFQIRTMNLANSRVDIHVNLDSFSRSDFDRLRLCTHVPGPWPCTSI